jgi:hypothetical protein
MKKLVSSYLLVFTFFTFAANAQVTLYSQAFTTSPADWSVSHAALTKFLATVPTPPGNTASVGGSGGGGAGLYASGGTPTGGAFLSMTTDVSTVGYTGPKVRFFASSNLLTGIASPTNMTVDFSTNTGSSWTPVTFTQVTTTNTWTPIIVNLPVAAENQPTLRVRFTFKNTGNNNKYYVDDVTLTGESSTTFFSKSTGTLDLLSSWTNDPAGVAGTSPSNFTNAGQAFIVRNGNPGTLAGNLTISGLNSTLSIESGHTFSTNATNSFTGTVNVNNGGTLNLVHTTIPTFGTLGSSSTVIYAGATSQTIPVATYGNVTISNATHTLGGNVSVPGTLTINSGAVLAVGDNNTLTITGTITGSGFLGGAATANATTNPSLTYSSVSSGTINVSSNYHFRNVTISNGVTLTLGTLQSSRFEVNNILNYGNATSTISIGTGELIVEGNITGSICRIVGNNAGSLSIKNTFISTPVTQSLVFVTTASLANFSITGRSVTLNSNLTVLTSLSLDAAALTVVGTRTVSVQGAFPVTNGGSLVPGSSTFNFNGSGAQSVPAVNFHNLTLAGTRTTNSITLAPGTIGVNSTLNVVASFTSGSYIVTGSTMNFNGITTQILKSATQPCILGGLMVSTGTLTDGSSGSVGQPGIRVRGDFTNNATFVCHSTNPLILDGTGAQNIGGTTTTNFNNLTISSSGTRTLSFVNPITITRDLSISGPATGTITIALGGNVSLKSTSTSSTAYMSAVTNPNNVTFTGNMIVERFAPGGLTGWNNLSSPGLSNQTFAEWNDEFTITCANCPDGWDVAGDHFGSIQTYNEQLNVIQDDPSRYEEIENVTDPMVNGKGYWVYMGDDAVNTGNIIIDQSGTPVKGNVTFPLTVTGGASQDHGWNFLGNPYPAAIDFDLLRNGNANVENLMQVYNPDVSDYGVYSGGVGTNGLDNNGTIPMGQAFYVHATAATTLTCTESCKSAVRSALLRTANPAQNVFRLKIDGLSFHDETVFHFNTNATKKWDSGLDAPNWYNRNKKAVNLSSLMGGERMAINALPPVSDNGITVPVLVSAGTEGEYTISPVDINSLPACYSVILHDIKNNIDHDLRKGAYTVLISEIDATEPNFELIISPEMNVKAAFTAPKEVYMENGAAPVSFKNTSQSANSFTWNVGDGSPVINTLNPFYVYNATGTFTVTLTASNTGCGKSDELQQVVVVMNQSSTVGLMNNPVLDNTSVQQDQNDAYVSFQTGNDKNAVIRVTDVLGRELVSPITVKATGNQTVALGLGDIRNQVVFITITSGNQQKTMKIVKN